MHTCMWWYLIVFVHFPKSTDGGIPYQVKIKGMDEQNGISESIVSSIFF